MCWRYEVRICAGNMNWEYVLEIRTENMCWKYEVRICAGDMNWEYVLEIWTENMCWRYELRICTGDMKWEYVLEIRTENMCWKYEWCWKAITSVMFRRISYLLVSRESINSECWFSTCQVSNSTNTFITSEIQSALLVSLTRLKLPLWNPSSRNILIRLLKMTWKFPRVTSSWTV